jgi:protein-tyrosine phosphatase
MPETKASVLFVCLGNICRSPTAHGVFRQLVFDQGLSNVIAVDSAGTGSWHVGEAPDGRAQLAARRRGYELADLRARQVTVQDFKRFDYVVAMDKDNLENLRRLVPTDYAGRLCLLLDFADGTEDEVPDPYYGGDQGFDRVLDMTEQASRGLLSLIQESYL